MRGFFHRKGFKVLLGVACVLVALTVGAYALGSWMSPQSSVIGAIFTPIQKFATSVSNSISSFFTAGQRADKLEEENERLREKVQELTSSLIGYDAYKQDNAFYAGFLELKEDHPDFQFCPAMVIARDPTEQFASFTIDQGTLNGVAPRDPVITADGLVGYISEAGPTFSTVTTLLDPVLHVGAIDSRTRDSGVVSGNLSLAEQGQCRMSYLSRSSSITLGDFIITSGSGGVFPQGILVGSVAEIKQETTDISLYAVIEPAVNPREVRDVMVITSFAGQGGVAQPSEKGE